MPLKTLFLNPPSFENFDGGAGSRWPATREIESYWYPVWLAYPAGMLEGARLLDAPPHHVSGDETIEIAKDYEFLVLFTSTPGFPGDILLARAIKQKNPSIKIAFVGPHVSVLPEKSLRDCPEIDFVCRKEFDFAVVDYAKGKPLAEIPGVSFLQDGKVVHNPDSPQIQDLDALPHVTDVYKRDLDVTRYNVPFLLNPFVSLYTTRGCPAQCTFCLWPQTLSGHPWRKRSTDDVAREMAKAKEYWPNVKEFFFDDDTFNIQKARTIELCAKLKPLGFTWSCTSRVTTDFERHASDVWRSGEHARCWPVRCHPRRIRSQFVGRASMISWLSHAPPAAIEPPDARSVTGSNGAWSMVLYGRDAILATPYALSDRSTRSHAYRSGRMGSRWSASRCSSRPTASRWRMP